MNIEYCNLQNNGKKCNLHPRSEGDPLKGKYKVLQTIPFLYRKILKIATRKLQYILIK